MELIDFLKDKVTLETLYYCFAISIGFDVFTGIVKACKNGKLRSRTLRDGMFVSFGELIFLALCIGTTMLIPTTHWIVFTILVIMTLKELASILENLIDIGVKLPTWLIKGLATYNEKLDNKE